MGDTEKIGELIRDMETTTALMPSGLTKKILEFVNDSLREELISIEKSDKNETLLNIPYTSEQKISHIKNILILKSVADIALKR